jgi:hypothetical protein
MVMAKDKPVDAFDLLDADFEHVGRHRARKTPKDRFVEFAWLALASVLLSGSGWLGLNYVAAQTANPQPTHHIVNGIDLSVPITVIDATGTRKYGTAIGQTLQDAGLVVPYTRYLDQTLTASSIHIQNESDRGLAKRIIKLLGKMKIVVKADAKYPIEVRLGKGYTPLDG